MLATVVIALLGGCGEKSAEESVAEARDYINKEQPAAAVIELKNALSKDPSDAEARWLLAQAYSSLGLGADAEKEYRRAGELGVDPNAVGLGILEALYLKGDLDGVFKAAQDLEGKPGVDQGRLMAILGDADAARGRTQEARSYYQKALDESENNLRARLGLLRITDEPNEKRLARVRDFTEEHPGYGPGWVLLGDLLRWSKQTEAAEAAYGKAIGRMTNTGEVYLKRAVTRIQLGELDAAESDLKRLQERYPRRPGTYYGHALLLIARGQTTEAQTELERVLNADPDYLPALRTMGLLMTQNGQDIQAQQYLSSYLQAVPASALARRAMAVSLIRTGDFDHAEQVLDPLVRSSPPDPQALLAKANLELLAGRYDQAIALIKRYLKLNPDSTEAQTHLGIGLLASGQLDEGLSVLRSAIRDTDTLQAPEVVLALAYLHSGRVAQARKLVSELEAKGIESALLSSIRGTLYAEEGDLAQAKAEFEKAAQSDTQLVPVLLSLARLAVQDKDIDAAIGYLERAVKTAPAHVTARLMLYDLYLAKGEGETATRLLEQGLELRPDAYLLRLKLARRYLQLQRPADARRVVDQSSQAMDDPGLLEVGGLAELAERRLVGAIERFQRLVELRPKSAEARLYLAQAYRVKGSYKEAGKLLRAAQELAPKDDSGIEAEQIRLLAARGDLAEAQSRSEALARAHPKEDAVWSLLMQIAQRNGDLESAVDATRHLFDIREDSGSMVALIRLLAQSGERRKALEEAQGWLEKHPDDQSVAFLEAELYRTLGRTEEAIERYRALLKKGPPQLAAMNNLASLLLDSGGDSGLREALEVAGRAFDLAPDAPPIQDTYGWALFRSGENARSCRILAKAAQGDDDPVIRAHYAIALIGCGQPELAREQARRLESVTELPSPLRKRLTEVLPGGD